MDVFYSQKRYTSTTGKLVSGIVSSFRPDGSLESVAEVEKGVLNGTYKYYGPDQNLTHEIPYASGQKHGTMRIYFPDGKLKCTIKFVNDEWEEFLELKKGDVYVLATRDDEGYTVNWSESGSKCLLCKKSTTIEDAVTVFDLFLKNNIKAMKKLGWEKIKE